MDVFVYASFNHITWLFDSILFYLTICVQKYLTAASL